MSLTPNPSSDCHQHLRTQYRRFNKSFFVTTRGNGSLPLRMDARLLRDQFTEYDSGITKVDIVQNSTGSKRYGKITFRNISTSRQVMREVNGKKLPENLSVRYWRPDDDTAEYTPLSVNASRRASRGIAAPLKKPKEPVIVEITEEILQCSLELKLYLGYKLCTQEFDALKKTLPVKITERSGEIVLHGSQDCIKEATSLILHHPLVHGLYLKLIHIECPPNLVYKKFVSMSYKDTGCHLYRTDSKCEVLLFGKNLTEFQEAKKLLEALKLYQKSYQLNPKALSLQGLQETFTHLEAKDPIIIEKLTGTTVILHGFDMEDIDGMWCTIKQYVNNNITVKEEVKVLAPQALYCATEYHQEAKKHSCELVLPPDCETRPPDELVVVTISGCKPNVKKVAANIKLIQKEVRSIQFKDEVLGFTLTRYTKHLNYLKRVASDESVHLSTLPIPQLGFQIWGFPKDVKKVSDRIDQYYRRVNIGHSQFVFNFPYEPLCSMSQALECREKVKKTLAVFSTFSSDDINRAHLCIQQDHVVTIEIVVNNLSTMKTDGIVIPTGKALTKDIYPIELPSLTTQSFQDGYFKQLYNSSHELTETGQTGCVDGGKLPSSYIIHTLFPVSLQRSAGSNHYNHMTVYKNCLSQASQKKLNCVAFPGINPKMVNFIIDSLILLKPTSLHTVSIVLATKDAARSYAEELERTYTASTTSSNHTWSWRDDSGCFVPYDERAMNQLNDAYHKNPKQPCLLTIGSMKYKVSFDTMTQTNLLSQNTRDVMKEESSDGTTSSTVGWMYTNDTGGFTSYISSDSAKIEEMFVHNDTSNTLVIQGRHYQFNFSTMRQINVNTLYQRCIKRVPSSRFGANQKRPDFLHNGEVVVNLKGPVENLKPALKQLHSGLKELLFSKDIRLPQTSTDLLQKRLEAIANKHRVGCVVVDNSEASAVSQRSLKIEGLETLVQKAVTEMQEVIISYIDGLPGQAKETRYPSNWVSMPEKDQLKIVDLRATSSEFVNVSKKIKRTLPNVYILKVQRVQNKWLWDRYVQTKDRLHKKNAGKINELSLFHGSRVVPPEKICSSEEGFDTRFSQEGMWGQASYFATKASYSDTYAYFSNGVNEMILALVLTGDSYKSLPDSSLRLPPEKPSDSANLKLSQVRYDSVNGITNGCSVYMIYSNDKAYPEYIVTYSLPRYPQPIYQPWSKYIQPQPKPTQPPTPQPKPQPKPSSCTIS